MPLASASTAPLVPLGSIDLLVIVIYFLFVLGIGFYLKRFAKSADDFFMAGRDMTAWVAGLAFMSANLGSLELMGWAAASYRYGILGALVRPLVRRRHDRRKLPHETQERTGARWARPRCHRDSVRRRLAAAALPIFRAGVVFTGFVALNIIFW